MKVKIIFLFLAVSIFLFSCHEQSSLDIILLKPVMIVDELSDSTFFKNVLCITHDDKYIFASDIYNGRILKFDLQMNYLESIGSRGEGPREFTCLGGIAALNDTLYAIDCVGLKTFTTSGDFVGSVKMDNHYIDPFSFCMDETGYIYLFSIADTFPAVKYDKYMNRLLSLGNHIGNEDEKSSYKLYIFEDKILSVKEDEPVISIYNRQGNVIFTKDFDNKIFESRLLFKKREQEKDSGNKKKTYILFSSITGFENKIYLLYDYHDTNNRPYNNRVVALEFKDNDFRFTKVYQLADDWYSVICYAGGKLICYSAINEEFQIYEL